MSRGLWGLQCRVWSRAMEEKGSGSTGSALGTWHREVQWEGWTPAPNPQRWLEAAECYRVFPTEP